ncbi:NAD(P)-binding protein [Zopfia rhizophila CBS 207.26]|uniref:NAD(P)-binding protein n=1 Tax=Zopfia rhizophila CBS 207.26 TaxID=1314779 RepID=A0A6A6ENI1_9PEZI|nr:NAD(P)-binding protein [Zopfia rhizophila CBS 207.26]
MTAPNQTLLLGAGELGTAFLPYLSSLPTTHITVAVRDVSKYIHLSKPNVSLISLDYSRPSSTLAQTFAKHDTIISCTGFGQNGTQKKLTEAVLEAGKLRKEKGKGRIWYFPWQWGVNYDITKDSGGLMPLFGEQLEVRNTLRSQAVSSNIKWTIVSTGMFMSFLFEPFWGMVVKEGDEIVARALRSWEHKVTATDVSDIGKMLVEILARGNPASENSIVYIV